MRITLGDFSIFFLIAVVSLSLAWFVQGVNEYVTKTDIGAGQFLAQVGGGTIDITSPTDGSTVSGTVNIDALYTGSDFGTFNLLVDGVFERGLGNPMSYAYDTTALSDGPHTFTVRVLFLSGGSQTETVTVTFNNSGGAPVCPNNIVETGEVCDGNTTSCSALGLGSGTATCNGSCSGWVTSSCSGADVTEPAVSITAPSSGATVSGTATISATASDDVAISSVQFRIDGTAIGTDTSSPYSVSWNTTSYSNGSHLITTVATDTSGNSAQVQRTVTISNVAGVCGNGVIDTGERCDDGNSIGGDGCSGSCLAEGGFTCAYDEPTSCVAQSPCTGAGCADCSLTYVGATPLTEYVPGETYAGFEGGLYPGNTNTRPAAHTASGLNIANSIVPLDANGNPDFVNGSIVFMGAGMSNTNREFNTYESTYEGSSGLNNDLVIVNGARSGRDITFYTNLSSDIWGYAASQLSANGVTPAQVQVVWMKQGLATPANHPPFPQREIENRDRLIQAVQNLKINYPNLKMVYLSGRTRAYNSYQPAPGLNPEYAAYEFNFAVKWAVEEQINGNTALAYGSPGDPAVWISWGPYLWIDGLGADGVVGGVPGRVNGGTAGSSLDDNMEWLCSDLDTDGVHPMFNGASPKVALMLHEYLRTDQTASVWYLDGGSPPPVCGNNIVESGEVCDGTNLAGQSCIGLGFTGGTLSCNSSCTAFVTSSCTSGGGDTNPPTVAITAPSNGSTVSGSVTISVTASDAEGTVSSVEFRVGGTTITTDTSSPYTASLNTATLSNAQHTVSAIATDNSGNSDSTSITVTVDNQGASTRFQIGERVEVTTSGSSLNIRSSANGTILGQQADGSAGTVIGGPTFAGTLWWWQVNFDAGVDGWGAEGFLTEEVGTVPPGPGPTVSFVPTKTGGSTCVAPCAVHFDATATTDAGTSRPYHDLLYEWDFGDPGSGNWEYGAEAYDGSTWSKNYDIGAIAGHLYENPGTYTVRLTVTNSLGQLNQTTRSVTVINPDSHYSSSNTYCFANSGSSFVGCPTGAQQVTTSDFDDALLNVCNFNGVAGRRCLFRAGDTFTISGGIGSVGTASSPSLVSSFGTGQFIINGQFTGGFGSSGSYTTWSNFVYNASSLCDTNSVACGFYGGMFGGTNNVTFYNLTANNLTHQCVVHESADNPQQNDFAFVNMECSSAAGDRGAGHQNGFFTNGSRHLYLGNYIDGNYTGEFNHRYRGGDGVNGCGVDTGCWYVVAHSRYRRPDASPDPRNNLQVRGAHRYGQIHDNAMSMQDANMFVRICQNNSCGPANRENTDAIVERNFFFREQGGAPSDIFSGIVDTEGGDMTIRNNIADYQGIVSQGITTARGILHQGTIGNQSNIHFINNTIYYDDPISQTFQMCSFQGGSGHQCINNLIYAPNHTGQMDISGGAGNVRATTNPFIGSISQGGLSVPSQFRLGSGSSAIDSSVSIQALTTDYFGSVRPQGLAFDAGAVEFGSGSPPPPSPVCGNNIVESGEVCDGTNLAGQSCIGLGFTGGALSCNSSCTAFVTSSCTSGGGDTNPPTVAITAPSNGATVSGTVTISATASDAEGTVSSVEFRVDGTIITTDTSSPYTTSLDTATLSNAQHTVSAIATDNSGNSDSTSITVTVDNQGASTRFQIGERIEVTTSGSSLNIRSSANGTILGQQADGETGVVIGGPTFAGTLWWWDVNFDTGVDGWGAEGFLTEEVTAPPPGPGPIDIYNIQSNADFTFLGTDGNALDLSYTVPVDGLLVVATGGMSSDAYPSSVTFVKSNGSDEILNTQERIVASVNSDGPAGQSLKNQMYYLPVTAGDTGVIEVRWAGGRWATARRGVIAATISGVTGLQTAQTFTVGTTNTISGSVGVTGDVIIISSLFSNGPTTLDVTGADHIYDARPMIDRQLFHSTRFASGHAIKNTGSHTLGYINTENNFEHATLILAAFEGSGSSPPPVCGNNIVESGEVCDGANLAGQSCIGLGFTGGALSCNSSCTAFVTSSCTSGGGSTRFQIGERIEVTTSGSSLNIRSSANGTILGQQADGETGVVIGGPTFAGTLWWWDVNFDTGVDGWGAEGFLTEEVGTAPQETLVFEEDFERGVFAGNPWHEWWVSSSPAGNATLGIADGEQSVSGTRAYEAEVLGPSTVSHRPYPGLNNFVLQTPLVTSFWTWLDTDFSTYNGSDHWLSLLTTDDNCDWSSVQTLDISDPSGQLHPVHINSSNLLNSQPFPVREWSRVTTYLDYNTGYMHVWQDGQEIYSANFSTTNGSICNWHWGLYAGAANTNVHMYQDDIKIWTLSSTITDFSQEPSFAAGAAPQCGNGIVEGSEVCDGNTTSCSSLGLGAGSATCSSSCTWVTSSCVGGGDTTPPTVSITAPLGGATLSDTVQITATATDNTGIANVTFSADGITIATDTTAPYSASWDTTNVLNGSRTITATAVDVAGNSNQDQMIVTVDNQTLPPGTIFSGVPYFGDRMNYAESTPSRWEVTSDTNPSYGINTSAYSSITGGIPGEQSIVSNRLFSDFQMDMRVRSSEDLSTNTAADFVIIFGRQDVNNYYYLIGNSNLQFSELYVVESGVRRALGTTIQPLITDNNWHDIRVTRQGSDITVLRDGTTQLTVSDSTFLSGTVGVGGFNDSAYFDDVSVTDLSTPSPGGTVNTITIVPLFESGQLSSNTSFVVTLIDSTTGSELYQQVISSDTQGDVVITNLNIPSGSYDIRVRAQYHLGRRINSAALEDGSTITLPLLPAGDLNDDGVINSLDWSVMSGAWFTTDAVADINRDTKVNSIDFLFINRNWGGVDE